MTKKYNLDLNVIKDMYLNQDKTYQEIADFYGCRCVGTIQKFLKKHNLKRKSGVHNCEIENCGKPAIGRFKRKGKYLCTKHYDLIKNNGYIKQFIKTVPNEIIKFSDHAEIVIIDYKKQTEKCRVLFDLEDIEKVSTYKWASHTKNKYVYGSPNISKGHIKVIALHRLIMNPPQEMQIDHINGDKLDNRKCNLRICTTLQNNHNKHKRKKEYAINGVRRHSQSGKYEAYITVNYKHICLGFFENIPEATRARLGAEQKYYAF